MKIEAYWELEHFLRYIGRDIAAKVKAEKNCDRANMLDILLQEEQIELDETLWDYIENHYTTFNNLINEI